MRVTVIGQGYVGLVTAAGLAERGNEVVGVEADDRRLQSLREGRLPIHEPGLDAVVERHLAKGSLRFTGPGSSALAKAQVVFVAVGTTDRDGGWQTATLMSCLETILPDVSDDTVVVVRSTTPPEVARRLGATASAIRAAAGRRPVAILLNPEFTREGTALRDFLQPDRVVVGVAEDPAGHGVERLKRLYRPFDAPFIVLTAVDAALSKLAANLFLATKISFANELAALCDGYGATVDHVVEAMAYDSRIGGSFLRPGVGFGGSCLPHQVRGSVQAAASMGVAAPLLAAVDEINRRQRTDFVERIESLLGGALDGARVALLGLTFKPDTDDMREAPSLPIAADLLAAGATVVAYDPMPRARRAAVEALPGIEVVDAVADALRGADVAALVTEWREFAALDWSAAGQSMRRRIVVDGRNALAPSDLVAAGFAYASFGRGAHRPEVRSVPRSTRPPEIALPQAASMMPAQAVAGRVVAEG